MNAQFHKLAPILALKQMPDKFRAFFIAQGYTEEQLQEHAILPDKVDKDNLENDALAHHAHSYKLQEITDTQGNKHLDYLEGDCLQKLKMMAEMARDYYREGDMEQVRYCLAKATHYRIDALTFPHLFHGQPWNKYHDRFEREMGHFIFQHQNEISGLRFEPYKDVYKGARETALTAWYEGQKLVQLYEEGKDLPDEVALAVCISCVQAVGNLWTTLAEELKLLP